MSAADGGQEGRRLPGKADALFAEFLAASPGGDGFDAFVARNAEHAAALEALRSMWIAGDLATPPAAGAPEATLAEAGLPGALQAFAGAAPSLGQVEIPGYRLGEVLGEGGFGVVYRAEQERPIRRTVAIKVIRAGMVTREVVARFDAERQALALMSHAAIARVFDAGTTARGQPYFVMEHIEGEPITTFCERRQLGVDERLELFLTVCEAVEHAHQKGVIHRDLKPSNVLVSAADGKAQPKVIDFGIAKALGAQLTEHTLQTEMGQVIGTPAYMSPEQADLTGTDIDTRTDIYSLGAVLHEVLTGLQPFDPDRLRRKSLIEILRFVREEEPGLPSVRLGRWLADTPPVDADTTRRWQLATRRLRGDLDWIVLRAMAKDRDRRYPAVSELAADIRRHQRHEPVLAGPPGALYRLSKLARKHRTAVSVAAALLVAAIGTASYLAYEDVQDRHLKSAGVDEALAARDVERARAALATLLDAHDGEPGVREREGRVAALDLELRSEASAAELARAAGDWQRHVERRDAARDLMLARNEKRRVATAAPPWQRGEELEIHQAYEAARREAQVRYDAATSGFQRAVDLAPEGSPAETMARAAFALALREMQRLADQESAVAFGPEFFRRRGAELDPAVFARRGGTVRLQTRPAGAEVHLFRFEEHENRLLPLPFDPRPGAFAGEPALVVERVREPQRCPFHAGDRLLEAAGKPLRVPGDLARALAEVAADASIEASVQRSSSRLALTWVPFPAAMFDKLPAELRGEPRRLVSFRHQLGFDLAGYPLEFLEACRLGRTDDAAPLEASLPDGSYLLVCRREGFLEARHPLRLTDGDAALDIGLVAANEAPAGFVHVPAGPFTPGGDPEAFQPLPFAPASVDDFLIGRLEVTFEEYLEFLNDPRSPVGPDGEGPPAREELRERVRQLVERGALEKPAIGFLPRSDRDGDFVVRGQDGKWRLAERLVPGPGLPVSGVSKWAAEEYAHWLTLRRCPAGVARFRLPTDLEWEKSARGADRRVFVWGDYPIWSFAWVYRGIFLRSKRATEVGLVPTDESVYGVRDLIGSVSEHALGLPSPPYSYASVRGGNWFNTDENYAHAATRNGLFPWNRAQSTGFRLVAELKRRDGSGR